MPTALFLAALLAAAPDDSVQRGMTAFDRGEFANARDSLLMALTGAALEPKRDAAARTYLAAALFELGDFERAQAQLRELFRRHPDAAVDPRYFVPPFVELAERERAALARRTTPSQVADAPVRAAPPVLTPAPRIPSPEPVVLRSSAKPYLRGVAVLSAATGLVLAGLAYGNSSALRGQPCGDLPGARCADFSWREAQGKSAAANREITGAAVALVVAVALGASSALITDEAAR